MIEIKRDEEASGSIHVKAIIIIINRIIGTDNGIKRDGLVGRYFYTVFIPNTCGIARCTWF
jgi:hypothetical protein